MSDKELPIACKGHIFKRIDITNNLDGTTTHTTQERILLKNVYDGDNVSRGDFDPPFPDFVPDWIIDEFHELY